MSYVNNRRASADSEPTVVKRVATSSDTSTTVEIVRAVADAESVPPGDLPLLSESVDPESVDDLFGPDSAADRSGAQLSFRYCGYTVSVTAETVTLQR